MDEVLIPKRDKWASDWYTSVAIYIATSHVTAKILNCKILSKQAV